MEATEVTIHSKTLNEIDNLNFSMLKLKLMDKDEGENWTYSKCDNAEWKYKMFLKLIYLYPQEKIVPDKEIDKFWHYHILDTRDYIKVTNKIFGRYLHHNPYFGLKDGEDRIELHICFQKTQELYKKHFGIYISNNNSVCTDGGDDSGDSSTCSSRCSN